MFYHHLVEHNWFLHVIVLSWLSYCSITPPEARSQSTCLPFPFLTVLFCTRIRTLTSVLNSTSVCYQSKIYYIQKSEQDPPKGGTTYVLRDNAWGWGGAPEGSHWHHGSNSQILGEQEDLGLWARMCNNWHLFGQPGLSTERIWRTESKTQSMTSFRTHANSGMLHFPADIFSMKTW